VRGALGRLVRGRGLRRSRSQLGIHGVSLFCKR
jgi:hypothetical protein